MRYRIFISHSRKRNQVKTRLYDVACKLLTDHFSPMTNVPYERSLFRPTGQQINETIEQFITRLRERAEYCNFGGGTDEMIRDQVIEKCISHRLRRKLLEIKDLTLEKLRQTAQAMEFADYQAQVMEGKDPQQSSENQTSSVNRIQHKNKHMTNPICYACGRRGHIKKDPGCPALKRSCNKCGNVGYFEKMCKTGNSNKHSKRKPSRYRVRTVDVNEDVSHDTEDVQEHYTFSISSSGSKDSFVM